MCALYGWLDCGKKLPHTFLGKLTQALANAAEERGTDATGISYVRNGRVTIFKRPKPAHKVRLAIPENTVAVMGHTRLATQGDKRKNWNNHPFLGNADKAFAFAHNGVLHNDSELKVLFSLPKTKIQTDSYVAVQLIEKQKKLDFNSLKTTADAVDGSFVFTILDENNTLYFVKGSNPLFLIYFKQFELYVYTSTKSIMDKALQSVGMQHEKYTLLEVSEGEMLSINSSGKIKRSQFAFEDWSFWGSARAYYDFPEYDEFDSDTEEEKLLLDMCTCFGVDKNDVYLLLEYGYTAEEIEDFISDTDVFRSVVHEILC